MKNNTAKMGREQIETNATLRTDEEQNIALWEAMRVKMSTVDSQSGDISGRGVAGDWPANQRG